MITCAFIRRLNVTLVEVFFQLKKSDTKMGKCDNLTVVDKLIIGDVCFMGLSVLMMVAGWSALAGEAETIPESIAVITSSIIVFLLNIGLIPAALTQVKIMLFFIVPLVDFIAIIFVSWFLFWVTFILSGFGALNNTEDSVATETMFFGTAFFLISLLAAAILSCIKGCSINSVRVFLLNFKKRLESTKHGNGYTAYQGGHTTVQVLVIHQAAPGAQQPIQMEQIEGQQQMDV